MPGTLFVVATPIGNLEDITLRALRVLGEVAVVAAEDTRRTGLLLRHYQIRTPLVSYHEHNERDRSPALVARLLAGASVALVSDAGTPLLSDPGLTLVREAVEAGVPVECVPGPSALAAALSVAALPIEGFTFVGFPPARSGERDRWLGSLASVPRTLVFYEAPHRVAATLHAILAVLGNRWTVLARELTKVHESVTRGWLADLLRDGIEERGEYVILLSDQKQPAPDAVEAPSSATTDDNLSHEFGRLTESAGLSRRDAADLLSSRLGIPRKEVYRRLRSLGKLG